MGLAMSWKTVPGEPTITFLLSLQEQLRAMNSWTFRFDGTVLRPPSWKLEFELSADPRKGTVLAVLLPVPLE